MSQVLHVPGAYPQTGGSFEQRHGMLKVYCIGNEFSFATDARGRRAGCCPPEAHAGYTHSYPRAPVEEHGAVDREPEEAEEIVNQDADAEHLVHVEPIMMCEESRQPGPRVLRGRGL